MTTDTMVSDPSAIADRRLEHALRSYHAGRFEAALESCDRALDCVPSLADAHNLRGIVLDELGRPKEAACAYGTAIDLDADHQEAAHNLRELAIELTERVAPGAPSLSDEEGEHPHTGSFARDSRTEMAELQVEKAYQAYESDRFDDAMAASYLAVALDPDSAEAHNLRGLVLEELGRPGAAAKAYRKACRLDPGLALAEDNLQELEAELAETRQLALVASFLHPLDAHVARGVLEAADIPTLLADEQMVTLNYFWSVGLRGVKLLVTEENAAEALEILGGQPETAEFMGVEEEGKLQCPLCQSYNTRYETYNLPLAYLVSLLGFFPHWISKIFFWLLLPLSPLLIPKRAWTCGSCGNSWKAVREPVPRTHEIADE